MSIHFSRVATAGVVGRERVALAQRKYVKALSFLDQAVSALRGAIRLEPRSSRSRLMLVGMGRRNEHPIEAEIELEALLAREPGDVEAQQLLDGARSLLGAVWPYVVRHR